MSRPESMPKGVIKLVIRESPRALDDFPYQVYALCKDLPPLTVAKFMFKSDAEVYCAR